MKDLFTISKATMSDVMTLSEMGLMLWPEDSSIQSLFQEFSQIIADKNAIIFIAKKNNIAAGFAHCQIRNDYVEGTETTPVGYLEGIYINGEHRLLGLATRLLKSCEEWLREKNIVEFASDCELTNSESIQFHLNQGFSEVNRIVCFTKRL